MASKNTKNQLGKIFILGIEGEEIFYSASTNEISSRLKKEAVKPSRVTGASKAAGTSSKPGSTGMVP